jgi:hypothetical protein
LGQVQHSTLLQLHSPHRPSPVQGSSSQLLAVNGLQAAYTYLLEPQVGLLRPLVV